jgi:hypothetical protein
MSPVGGAKRAVIPRRRDIQRASASRGGGRGTHAVGRGFAGGGGDVSPFDSAALRSVLILRFSYGKGPEDIDINA